MTDDGDCFGACLFFLIDLLGHPPKIAKEKRKADEELNPSPLFTLCCVNPDFIHVHVFLNLNPSLFSWPLVPYRIVSYDILSHGAESAIGEWESSRVRRKTSKGNQSNECLIMNPKKVYSIYRAECSLNRRKNFLPHAQPRRKYSRE